MSYTVDYQSGGNETSPSIPGKTSIDLPTSVVDTTSTSLALTGKGVPNYGEIQQENFIRLLENFASKTAPANPTIGQVWFDSTVSSLKVYGMDTAWHKIGGVTTAASAPSDPQTGDLWYDTTADKMMVWDGAAWVPLGGGTNAGPSAPTGPNIGDLWYDTTNSLLKVWNGSAWVPVSTGGGVSAGSTPPAGAQVGALWYHTVERILYVKTTPGAIADDIPLYYTDWAQVWPSITRFASWTAYNVLAARVNKVVGSPTTTGAAPDVADNQWGWGQTDTLEIFTSMNAPSAFDNTKWILMNSRIRKALRHTTTAEQGDVYGMISDGRGPSTLATNYTPATTWKAGWSGNGISDMATALSNISTVITALENARFTLNPTGMQVNATRSDATAGATWASTRVLDLTFQFTNDTAAKAFFNAGSAIRLTTTLASGAGVGLEWYNLVNTNLLNSSGFVMDYKGSRIGFAGAYGTGGTTAVGFYDLTTSFQNLATYTRGGPYGTGGLVIQGMYNSATGLLTIRMSFNEDFAAGQSVNKTTVATDIRASVTAAGGAPYLDTPAVIMPTVAASGTFLTAAAGT